MYEINNSEKLFSDELNNWVVAEAGFKKSIFQMSVYSNYAPDGSKLFVLSYVYGCVYWYTYEELVKWFMDTHVKIFHVNFLGYTHWFMYIGILQHKGHYISVDQDRYATSIVAEYLDTAKIK